MQAKTKIAITWAELILILLLVSGGIGIWAFVAEQVEASVKSQEPIEELSINTVEVVTQKVALDTVQIELTAMREELTKQQITFGQKDALLASLQLTYPSLTIISAGNALSPEILKAYWDAQLAEESARQQIATLDSQISTLITKKAELSLKLRQLTAESKEYMVAFEQQTYTNEQLVALKGESASLKLDLAQQESLVNAMEALRPGLANYLLSNQTTAFPATDVIQKYLDGLAEKSEIENNIALLSKQITAKQADFITASIGLTTAQKMAHDAYLEAQKTYLDTKRLETAKQTSLWVGVYLLAVFLLYGVIALFKKSWSSFATVFLITLAALLILLAYQGFQVMGAAMAGVLIFIFLLVVLRTPAKAGEKP